MLIDSGQAGMTGAGQAGMTSFSVIPASWNEADPE